MGHSSSPARLIPYQTDTLSSCSPHTSPQLLSMQSRPTTPSMLASNNIETRDSSEDVKTPVWDKKYSENVSYLSFEKHRRPQWPRGSEYVGCLLGFTLSVHSLVYLPVIMIQNGGISFLFLYIIVLVSLGASLLLLEMFLGQYSHLAPVHMFWNLCPLIAGLGICIVFQSVIRLVIHIATIMWITEDFIKLYVEPVISPPGDSILVLLCICVTIFLLSAASFRVVGKLCLFLVSASIMILVSLSIRSCLALDTYQSLMPLLSINWDLLSSPSAWIEAVTQVIFSLQLGLGSVSTFSCFNPYQHNIIRDSIFVIVCHLVWVLLITAFVSSLFGEHLSTLNSIDSVTLPSILSKVKLSLTSLSSGWLWDGFFNILIIFVSISSIFGYLEVISSSVVSLNPSLHRFKPLVTLFVMVILFFLNLLLTMYGDDEFLRSLHLCIFSWPSLLFSLFTILGVSLSLGTRNLLTDLGIISKISLNHFVTCHLSVIYTSILPILLLVSLGVKLYYLYQRIHLELRFSLPFAFSLVAFHPLMILATALILLVYTLKSKKLKSLIRPTETWYRNTSKEMSESCA